MVMHWERHCKETDRTEVSLGPLVTLAVQLLVLELCRTLLACLLVLLAVGLLAAHVAVFDEAAGRAVLELDDVALVLAAVCTGFVATIATRRVVHCRSRLTAVCFAGKAVRIRVGELVGPAVPPPADAADFRPLGTLMPAEIYLDGADGLATHGAARPSDER